MLGMVWNCIFPTWMFESITSTRRNARSHPFLSELMVWQYPPKLTHDKGKTTMNEDVSPIYKNGDFRFVLFVLRVTGPTECKFVFGLNPYIGSECMDDLADHFFCEKIGHWNKGKCLGEALHLLFFSTTFMRSRWVGFLSTYRTKKNIFGVKKNTRKK